MPPNLRVTRLAAEDLEEILHYTLANWGVGQFHRYRRKLFEGFATIAGEPKFSCQWLVTSG